MTTTPRSLLGVCFALTLATCSDADAALVSDGVLDLTIHLPQGAGAALQGAAEDVLIAARKITGADGGEVVTTDPGDCSRCIVVTTGDGGLGEQDYQLESATATRLTVAGATDIGAMYGLYDVAGRLGARYHHPEETFYPRDPALALPQLDGRVTESPAFELRGFHEHTQHPIVFSDFYLRPDEGFEDYVSAYIRWMARNRQNAMSWHMLKTVDQDAWLPYIGARIDEAHEWGVRVGMVMSFVDQQQNNFKILIEDSPDDERTQIKSTLGRLADEGFDFFTFQIGSSEFTKPDDAAVLGWLQIVAEEFGDTMDLFTWIHTTCDLESDAGGYFFHLPGEADPRVGAWAHTTMFYDLEHPAPVYSCETFHQQRDFIVQEQGERDLVYFPETAWWLGFDNNVPLALPVTGWTRANDINNQLAGLDVRGHITFTTGREWGYWQYDHYLQQATWDDELTWESYLEWIEPMFGSKGGAMVDALTQWTELQRQHFLVEDPLIYFYVAGELRQDEIGAKAGILARRPKIAFTEVLNYDDATFAAWETRDLALLERMHADYKAVLDMLAPPSSADTLADRLYAESWDALQLFVWRVEHTVELYRGVTDARRWRIEQLADTPDASVKDAALADAQAHLTRAREITQQVLTTVSDAEARYRYPIELLAREKPETLTSYPYGYLEETATAHFWARRDDQLDSLIGVVFDTVVEQWSEEPERIFVTNGDNMALTEPDNELASTALTGFIPQMLVAVTGFTGPDAPTRVVMAEDFNKNLLPDAPTETVFDGARDGDAWTGTNEAFILVAYNDAGERFGELTLVDAALTLHLETAGDTIDDIPTAELAANVISAELIALIRDFAGIDEDGVTQLLKDVFGVPVEESLPTLLPIAFELTFIQP